MIGPVARMALLAGSLTVVAPCLAVAGSTKLQTIIDRNLKTRGAQLDRVEKAPVTTRDPGATTSATAATLVPARIWLHVRRPDQRSFKTSFDQTIGATIPVQRRPRDLEWMPIQQVDVGPSRSQIRFFKDYDRETATVLKRAFARQGVDLEIHDMTKRYASSTWIEPGHIEVWLGPDARMP